MDLDSLESGRRELPKRIRHQTLNKRHLKERELRPERGREMLWTHLLLMGQLRYDENHLGYLAKTLSCSWKNFPSQKPRDLGEMWNSPKRPQCLAAKVHGPLAYK